MVDGQLKWVNVRAEAEVDAEGRVVRITGVTQDVTDRKRGEEALRASLREKEALLKEVHHRVKNNLQLVSSLLSLQAARVEDPAARDLIAVSRNRVRSMAILHESLYRAGSFAGVPMAAQVSNLCNHLFRFYGVDGERVKLQTRIADVVMDLDRAVPCVLIINELVSNALKYAFPNGRPGLVSVELHGLPRGRYTLVVADDGIGLPRYLDPRQTDTLGLQLVGDLAQQLRGIVALDRDHGTTFTITFNVDSGGGQQP